MNLNELIAKLADKTAKRTEADIQADVRQLLIDAPLDLSDQDLEIKLESQVGQRRRIDVEIGRTVIEVKKDLRKGNILSNAIEQLTDYVATRTDETGQNYVGILTDGEEWLCFHLTPSRELVQVTNYKINRRQVDVDGLILWLDGVLATKIGTIPTPDEIQNRLGSSSSSYAIDRATLASLYEQNKHLPTVQMKRTLWAKLLTTALGSQFEDTDELFVEHTLLVCSAEVIAHAVLGFDINSVAPTALLSGRHFEEAQIYGAVESDFFDWILEVVGGEAFVRSVARKMSRFDWSDVSYDLMKVLYESIIPAEIRKKLGEYYTPDWLAHAIVEEVIDDPLNQRVLDPSCGSGTFLFHAIRRARETAALENLPLLETVDRITKNILGFDIHPVAVTLARVTYLLALGRDAITSQDRNPINIPVYLGDSMQWQQEPTDLLNAKSIVIETNDRRELFGFGTELRLPTELLKDSKRFDMLVNELAKKAQTAPAKGKYPSLNTTFQRYAIHPDHKEQIKATFARMCDLHRAGRDHIWSYYIRNLVRPKWLERNENRVDVLIGNPPWLSYRFMPTDMQQSFKQMSEARRFWDTAKMATQQDLSALFVAKSVQMYLKADGKFAFVMPNSVVDRDYYAGFRTGDFSTESALANVAFNQSWDLRRIRPHIFPRGASVIFGARNNGDDAVEMPRETEFWAGSLHNIESKWEDIRPEISRQIESLQLGEKTQSPYHNRFINGATIVPRVLFIVAEQPRGPLGGAKGFMKIRSKRSAYEKQPWKLLPDMEGVIERQFVRPLYMGRSIIPFRALEPDLAVIPYADEQLYGADHEQLDMHPKLYDWWMKAENHWNENRSKATLSLIEQIDYRSKLKNQFPIQSERILYATSGMYICATRISDPLGVIDTGLYWAAINSIEEGQYLCAILNTDVTTQKTRPLMSYGKDERHVHKHVWKLNIPMYDPTNSLHQELAEIGTKMEEMVAALTLRDVHFATLRKDVRKHIRATPEGIEMENLVTKLLSG